MKGLFEIMTNKEWMINPEFVHGIRKALEQNLNTHAVFEKPQKTCGFVTAIDENGCVYYPEEYQISEDGTKVKSQWALKYEDEQTFPFVSVLTVDGPITRNGGGCSYGSVDHRNMMINAANHPLCRGHIFIIDTPGGTAWAKNDYEQAINYARSLGQPVLCFIDGDCYSAGMYLASLCDERYYMHPKDGVGCIGVMGAFYTEADGSTNKFTNETYHEIYDPESYDKNREFRDIANDGNTEKFVAELAELGVEFRRDVKKACPKAKKEHLHGKIFTAEEAKGILVDGQSTFLDCIKRCFDLYNGTVKPIEREITTDDQGTDTEGTEKEPKNASTPATVASSAQEPTTAPSSKKDKNNNNFNQTHIDMKNYPLISAACGIKEGEIEVNAEGAFMNVPLLDSLEAHMKEAEQKVADAEQKATAAEQSLAELQGKVDELSAQVTAANEAKEVAETALAQANEAHSKELSDLNAQHADALAKKDDELNALTEAKDKEIAQLTSEKSDAEVNLQTTKDALATAEQTIADKQAQIAALTNEAGEELNSGDAPENNGEGVKTPQLRSFDPSKYKTNVERKAAFERFKRGEE